MAFCLEISSAKPALLGSWERTVCIHAVCVANRAAKPIAVVFRAVTDSFPQCVKQFASADGVAKTCPGIVKLTAKSEAEGHRGQCADEGDLQFFAGGRAGVERQRRRLEAELGIFV